MERTKIIKIKDLDNDFIFRIRLFGAEEGFNFLNKISSKIKDGFELKPYIDDLLPLISLMDADGKNVVKDGLTTKDCFAMFQNPLTIFEISMEAFKFQEVFLDDSVIFRPIINRLRSIWTMNDSESQTK